jgi:hypothetical protein
VKIVSTYPWSKVVERPTLPMFPKAKRGVESVSYRGVLLSTLLHYMLAYTLLHNLLNVLIEIANKMGLPKTNKQRGSNISYLRTL